MLVFARRGLWRWVGLVVALMLCATLVPVQEAEATTKLCAKVKHKGKQYRVTARAMKCRNARKLSKRVLRTKRKPARGWRCELTHLRSVGTAGCKKGRRYFSFYRVRR